MFGSECYYLKEIVWVARNDGYIALYNKMRLVHPLLMDDPVEFHIPYQKNSMSFPDHVENILTHVEREYL